MHSLLHTQMSSGKEADAKADQGASKELGSAKEPQLDKKDNPEDQKAEKKDLRMESEEDVDKQE